MRCEHLTLISTKVVTNTSNNQPLLLPVPNSPVGVERIVVQLIMRGATESLTSYSNDVSAGFNSQATNVGAWKWEEGSPLTIPTAYQNALLSAFSDNQSGQSAGEVGIAGQVLCIKFHDPSIEAEVWVDTIFYDRVNA